MKRWIALLVAIIAVGIFSAASAQENFDSYADYGKAVSRLSQAQTKGEFMDALDSRLLLRSKKAMANLADFGATAVVAGPGNHYTMQFATVEEALGCMKTLKGDPNVIYVHQDRYMSIDKENTTLGAKADPYRSWGALPMGADELAQTITASGTITAAIIDTGVSRHPFIKNRIKSGGVDFVQTDNKDGTEDGHGHGTHVAGTVVDLTQGLNVRILPVRVLDEEGNGSSSAISNGIRYAADAGAKIINLSLGATLSQPYEGNMTDERDAIDYAVSKGVTVVVAAGNESEDVSYGLLSCYENVIVVGAIDSTYNIADFSNFGDTLDVVAPGVNISSCDVDGGYISFNGTSMATPHIVAIAAMVKLDHPGYSPARVESYIKANCLDLGPAGWDRTYGYGMPSFAKSGDRQEGDYTYRINNDGAVITGFTGTDTSITLPETLAGYNVVAVGEDAFKENNALVSVEIPGCYKEIGNSAFSQCVNLKDVTLSEGTIKIGDRAFTKCESLLNVSLPDSLTDIGGDAFSYCSSLKGIKLPPRLESIGGYAFEHSGLTSMVIPASIGKTNSGILAYCEDLESVTIEDGILEIGFEMLSGCKILKSVVVPEGVVTMGDYSLADCPALTSGTFPRSLVFVQEEAFYNSPNITINSYTGSNVESIAYNLNLPFVSLGIQAKLTKITPKFDTPINLMPGETYNLRNLYEYEPYNASIPDLDWKSSDLNVADIITHVDEDFGFTTIMVKALTQGTCVLTGTAADESGLYMTQEFIVGKALPRDIHFDKNSLTLNEGETAQIIASVVPSIANQSVEWHSDNPEIASVDEKGLVTAHKTGTALITAESVEDLWVFAVCEVTVKTEKPSAGDFELTILDDKTAVVTGYTGTASDVSIPAVIDGRKIVSIGEKAFYQSDITSIAIPEGVEMVNSKAFAGCKKLKSAILPESLQSLATDAFANCKKLPKVKKLSVKLSDSFSGFFVVPVFTPSNTASSYSITASPKKNADIDALGHVDPETDDYFSLTVKASGKKAVIGVKDREPYAASEVTIKGKATRNAKTGKEIKLKYTVKPDSARVIATWQSSDTSIATVSQDGVVTPLAPGKVKITLDTDLGLSDSITLKVTGKPIDTGEGDEGDEDWD